MDVVSLFQDLEEKIKMKSAALQELKDKHSNEDFIRQIDDSAKTCAALTQQVSDTRKN